MHMLRQQNPLTNDTDDVAALADDATGLLDEQVYEMVFVERFGNGIDASIYHR